MNNSDERDYAEEAANRALLNEERDNHLHTWVAGMMHVHPEEVQAVARERRANGASPVECESCEFVYDPDNPPDPEDYYGR